MLDDDADHQQPESPTRNALAGGRAVAATIVLLLTSSLVPTLRPLLIVTTLGIALYWIVRTCFRLGKPVGVAAIAVLCVASTTVVGIQYAHHLNNEELASELSVYDSVTIRRSSVLPSADVIQVSFKGDVSDDDIAAVTAIPELKAVTHVFIKNCDATDNSLRSIEAFAQLEYVFIQSPIITDAAIAEFEERHPHCTVIPYGRR